MLKPEVLAEHYGRVALEQMHLAVDCVYQEGCDYPHIDHAAAHAKLAAHFAHLAEEQAMEQPRKHCQEGK